MTCAAYLSELSAIFRAWERFYDAEIQTAKAPLVRVLCEQAWEAANDLAEVNEREAAKVAYQEAR